MRRIPRTNRVFSYSAEHPPCGRVAPGERILVETKNAFGDQTFEPGETLENLQMMKMNGAEKPEPDTTELDWISIEAVCHEPR